MSKQGPTHRSSPATPKRKVTFTESVPLPEAPEQRPAAKSPAHNKLDGELASASTALKTPQSSSSKGRLDELDGTIVDSLQTDNKASYLSSMGASTCAIDIGAMESNITGWAESSKVLMSALDGIASIHPVVGVAVLAFKAVVTLEMNREDNDKKVVALYLQMQEMMSVLLQLRGIDNPHSDGVMLRHRRLEPLMIKIAQDITKCGNLCDTYSKKNILVKVLKSPIYERRFADYLTKFSDRKREIQLALVLHTSLVVESASSKINSVHDKASSTDDKLSLMITLLFRRLDSPHESELMKFIDMKGGVDMCMADDKALMGLAAIRRRLQGGPVVVDTSPEGATAALSREAPQVPQLYPSSSRPQHHQSHTIAYYPSQVPATQRYGSFAIFPSTPQRSSAPATVRLDELKSEFSEDVDLVLNRNMVIFTRKLDVQRQSFLELTAVVKTQSDRVIKAVDAGPHDRVVDLDLRAIWKDMGWRSSVEARTFVFAVHTYFTERYHDTDPLQVFLTSSTPKGIQDFRSAQALANKRAGDWEVAEYISMVNLRPILESFDDDRSGFITIREVNSLTAAKPEYMNLPEWISYWAVGWHFILSEYKTKICGIISNMYDSRKRLLPTNRAMVDIYLDSPTVQRVDLIMYPLEPFVTKLEENMKQKFIRYAKEEEKRMEANLKLMAYEIDAPSTLALITGPGRIEKYLFPLLFLLLRHHSRIINVAAREILAREELIAAVTSIQLVLDMVEERAHTLKVIFKELYMLNDTDTIVLSGTAFGMFVKLSETIDYGVALENLQGSYDDDGEPDALQGQLLKHRVEELDRTVYDLMPIVSPTILTEPSRSPIEGTWSGFVEGSGDGHGLFQVNFSLHPAHTWTLQGSGLDVNGPFELLGNVHDDGSFTVTLKREEVTTVSDSAIPLYLSGKFEPSKSELKIEWGTGPRPTAGEMTLYPGPSELTRFRWNTVQPRNPGDGSDWGPARIRWSFACSAILDRVRAKMWCKSFFRERLDRRRDYTTLYRRQYLLGSLEGEEVSKLATLERTLSPVDVRFYRSICRSHYSICHHLGTVCDNCEKEITGDRYMCVDECLSYDRTGPNFCSACINLPSDTCQCHQPNHTLLKFSRFVQSRERLAFVGAAVPRLGQYHPTDCSVCHSTGKPLYWCCVICCENVMICENCDPQCLLNMHAIHDGSHPMLRIETAAWNGYTHQSPSSSQEAKEQATHWGLTDDPLYESYLPSGERDLGGDQWSSPEAMTKDWPRAHGFEIALNTTKPVGITTHSPGLRKEVQCP